jgi:hypothetical protein
MAESGVADTRRLLSDFFFGTRNLPWRRFKLLEKIKQIYLDNYCQGQGCVGIHFNLSHCSLILSVAIKYAGSLERTVPSSNISDQEAVIPVPTDAAESINRVDPVY